MENDIIELRNGGYDNVHISVNLINAGVKTQLFFGSNANLPKIRIHGSNIVCGEFEETAPAIKIQKGKVIESTCIGQ